jgi:hypothetical protein
MRRTNVVANRAQSAGGNPGHAQSTEVTSHAAALGEEPRRSLAAERWTPDVGRVRAGDGHGGTNLGHVSVTSDVGAVGVDGATCHLLLVH